MASRSRKAAGLLPVDTTDQVDLTVAVPSMGRPGEVLVDKVLKPDQFVVVVPEGEVEAYRAAQPDLRFDTHADDLHGLSRKRQWMYDKYGDILMLDDDVFEVMHVEHVQGESKCLLTGDDAMALFTRTATECRAMGAYLFGFGDPDVRNYMDQAPIVMVGAVIGSAMGLLAGSGLTFNPEIVAADDFWISLLNAREHRIAWQDTRYAPNCKPTFTTLGGTSSQRTMGTEEADFKILRRYFGEAVKRKESTARAKVRHEWQRTVFLPF